MTFFLVFIFKLLSCLYYFGVESIYDLMCLRGCRTVHRFGYIFIVLMNRQQCNCTPLGKEDKRNRYCLHMSNILKLGQFQVCLPFSYYVGVDLFCVSSSSVHLLISVPTILIPTIYLVSWLFPSMHIHSVNINFCQRYLECVALIQCFLFIPFFFPKWC